jgi:hypothetical protein
MSLSHALCSFVLLALSGQCFAHRLDEYLQATMISLGKDRIVVEMRLSPGVAVAPFVVAAIDRDADGVLSNTEQTAYVDRVRRDVSITLDGDVLTLHLISKKFASVQEMREGRGEIQLEFFAGIPGREIVARKLLFENHHQSQIGAYLVNILAPADPDIRILSQIRNFQQSSYHLDYSQARVSSGPLSLGSQSGQRAWLIALALLMTSRFIFLWWRRAGAGRFMTPHRQRDGTPPARTM